MTTQQKIDLLNAILVNTKTIETDLNTLSPEDLVSNRYILAGKAHVANAAAEQLKEEEESS